VLRADVEDHVLRGQARTAAALVTGEAGGTAADADDHLLAPVRTHGVILARTLGGVDDLFAPPGPAWQRVSPALARMRRTLLVAGAALVLVGLVVVTWAFSLPLGPVVVGAAVVLGAAGWGWVLIGHNARRWGYAELEEDLYITRGALFRRLVVVPYGRMQYVDVQAGPLDRAFGIARIQLHTASPGTSAHLPGLPADEAARLRDRLTSLGEAQAAGL
jgi:membrane protein YdbS with pleckstrin-like domain